MEISAAAKVGMIVVLALVMLGLIVSQLGNWKYQEVGVRYYVVFDNVAGLQSNAPVRKAGVKIGQVTEINIIGPDSKDKSLVDKVRVTIYVSAKDDKGKPIQLSQNSLYTISSSFMGDKWLEIYPREGPILEAEHDVMGKSPVSLDDLIVKGEETLGELKKAVDNFNGLVGDTNVQKDLKQTVSNFKAISGNLKKASAKFDTTIDQLGTRVVALAGHADVVLKDVDLQIKSMGGDVKGFTSSLNRMTKTNEPRINDVVKNLQETSHNLNSSMKAINDLVTNEKFSKDILKTLDNIASASEEVEGIASDVRSITSDPQIKSDIKATIHEARETVKGANDLIKRVRATLGLEPGEKLKLAELDASMEWNTQTGRSAANTNLWLLPKSRHTMKVGVEDIGNNNYFNLQYGRTMKSVRPRIGIIRSEAGVGADAFMGKHFELNMDAYDPTDVKVDFLGRFLFNGDFYVMGGVRDAFDGKQGVIGVGKKF
jgi:phospholipid/cholesterol/gamma-HCH transport system substrate-binding protein